MKINSIGTSAIPHACNSKNQINNINVTFLGKPIVPKTTERFEKVWYDKLPVTLKDFFNNLKDKSEYTPLQALNEAFIWLSLAESIKDVKDLFPKECENDGLFANLKDYKNTKATIGLFGIYREYKELFENGILKSGEDLSVYLLKKLFLEAKTTEKINEDLEKDLNEDIKNEFKYRYPNNENKYEYIHDETIRDALGIKRLNPAVLTSLRYTDDIFRNKVIQNQSEAQKNAWKNLTPQQQEERVLKLRDNYKKWLDGLSETEKASMLKARINAWYEMSSEERTELINRLREINEPIRYAMIDAWNNSEALIKELSEFLKLKQGLKPIDLLYSDEKFSVFQSIVMTEFWDTHKDLASEFGKTLKLSLKKVNTAIQNGRFWILKKDIEKDRSNRIKIFNQNKINEEKKSIEIPKHILTNRDYKDDFKTAYKNHINGDMLLPPLYINEMTDIILAEYPQEVIEKLTEVYKTDSETPEDLAYTLKAQLGNKNYEKIVRLKRALEAAIAQELYYINHNPEVFAMEYDALINEYKQNQNVNGKLPNIARIQEFYNRYKTDITDKKLNNIVVRYFTYINNEDEKLIANYVKSYGQTALILFSDESAFSDDVKIQFNEKFLKLMPEEVKNICIPVLSSPDDVTEEQHIKQIKSKIKERYHFMPDDFLNAYIHEVIYTIHLYRNINDQNENIYSIKSFEKNVCKRTNTAKNDKIYQNKYIKIPKMSMLKENKIKVLAAEQAIADELFRVTGKESIYEFEIEQLMNIFEAFSMFVDVVGENGDIKFQAKEPPNKYYVKRNYQKYLSELNQEANDIFENEGCIKNREKLIEILIDESDNELKNNCIKERIKIYIEEPDRQSINSISELKKNS